MESTSITNPDTVFAEAVGKHILRMDPENVQIFPSERTSEGWLEWLLVYTFKTGGRMTVGAIQRTPDSPMEFHS
jgi:hypothetical protein